MSPDQSEPDEPPAAETDETEQTSGATEGPGARASGASANITAHPRVDAALAELDRIAPLAPADQVDGYAQVHQELQSALAALDEER